ncbi:MAG: TraR/DksA C4-type zinc finger protein [Anaerolineae bacterium]|jgi:RNA polymerase-binding transcription factor DksA|nr:TraR/DksA C4-type zinc finger protein [Anaerolineae bacterium]
MEQRRGALPEAFRLVEEFEALTEQIRALEAALEVRPEYGMGIGDPAVTQWELDHALLARLRVHAENLQQAIARYDSGTYGVCERCGQPIHPDRLAVLPDAKLCVACAQKGL